MSQVIERNQIDAIAKEVKDHFVSELQWEIGWVIATFTGEFQEHTMTVYQPSCENFKRSIASLEEAKITKPHLNMEFVCFKFENEEVIEIDPILYSEG